MARRLRTVQDQIRMVLDSSRSGPLRVVSLCAGQGRDLLEVLCDHSRRSDVRARLVELDENNTAVAAAFARANQLDQIEIMTGDASLTDQYLGMVPADLVLICGLFGNIADADITRTIDACPQLCATGGHVIWTRHRRTPDRVPLICEQFEALGFERRWLSGDDTELGVGVHRFSGQPQPLENGQNLFQFVGYDRLLN
jgi:hypothetical protein